MKLLLIVLTSLLTYISHACTIFLANDGKHVWVGNNEDALQNTKYRLWFYPAAGGDLGYSIWTELPRNKALSGLAYLNPQGGLNESGLFLDYTAIDKIKAVKDPSKKDRKREVATEILRCCKTVAEALVLIQKYNLANLTEAQLFIADAGGDYATVTGAYITRKTASNFALTNYQIGDQHKEACHRRDAALEYLGASNTFDLAYVEKILERTAQKLPNNLISNYSMAVDLKTNTLHLFYKNDFSFDAGFVLSNELKKGKHHADMENRFPRSIAPILKEELTGSGIAAAIKNYRLLRLNNDSRYNFKNDDALKLAVDWLSSGKAVDALAMLDCLSEFDSTDHRIKTWRAIAKRKLGADGESDSLFAEVLSRRPDDYLATLFGKQREGTAVFKLADFEGAQSVSLMGKFTQWTKNPIKMTKQNGYWYCEAKLPRGEVIYKFIVNDQYLADSKNEMFTGTGPDIFSKLFVW